MTELINLCVCSAIKGMPQAILSYEHHISEALLGIGICATFTAHTCV